MEEQEGKEKKRIYWKDIIAKEEEKAEKMAQEAEAERIKLGKDGDDKGDEREVKEITSINPIADFTSMINDRKTDRVGEAISQMQKMIERFVESSLAGDLFDKAIDCLKGLREACVREDEAESFNKFAEKVKSKFQKGEKADFFKKMANNQITLITKHESKISSNVEQEEANAFLELD